MATLTPARITYFLGDAEQVIRFHSVISEAHQASSEITKYPVQSGFQISNHAIRHNRKITIEAIISNTLLEGGKTAYQYSLSDNNQTIFNVLRDLVNFKMKTTVLTNLGKYTPVVFTSFKTKQMAGMVDSMKVVLLGEELQISDAINGSSPAPVSWVLLTAEETKARIDSLKKAGTDVCDCAVLSEAKIDLGGDFSIENLTNTGKAALTSFIAAGQDLVTGAYNYAVHTTDTEMFTEAKKQISGVLGSGLVADLTSGISGVSDCLMGGALDIAESNATKAIDTAMGKLTSSSYGAYYDTIHMTKNDIGQELIGLSSGCIVRGITGFVDDFGFQPGESLPTTDQIIQGAKKFGEGLFGGTDTTSAGVATTSEVLTKIQCGC